jgi:hypothetical protein
MLQVLAFCEALADAAQLRPHLMLQTRVLCINPVPQHSTADIDQAKPECCTKVEQPLCQQAGLQWRMLTETQRSAQTTAAGAPLQKDAMALEQQQQQQQQQRPQQGEGTQQEWLFDAVASCVGIFSEISLPQVGTVNTHPAKAADTAITNPEHTQLGQEAALLLHLMVWGWALQSQAG